MIQPHTSTDLLSIAVLAGGDSAERAISLASGAAVANALREAGHQVSVFDPAVTGWLELTEWHQFDACFIALHGGAGEDGRIQQQLADRSMAYTGSGPAASRLAMSKSASKERFRQSGVPTPPYVLCHASQSATDLAAQASALDWPVVVKPDMQGSSLGVGVAENLAQLVKRLAESFKYDAFALVEPRIVGRELTVAVLDRRVLPVLEVISPDGIFSYDSKYHSSATRYRFDPPLAPGTLERVRQVAGAAADALNTAGLVRVDMMLDHGERPLVLEVNTIPGMTERSLAPKMAARAGIDFPALCDLLVRRCLTLEACT